MKEKKTFTIALLVAVTGFTLLVVSLFLAIPAYAQASDQEVDNGNCITCHEDLYFLHDTGNWFCIRESPMPCVACHGGDPTATTQESAHYDRSAHPIVEGDISRCQECHVNSDECCECVSKFDRVAGIRQVKQASPISVSSVSDSIPSLPKVEEQESVDWLAILEIFPLVVIAGVALIFYIVHKVRHV